MGVRTPRTGLRIAAQPSPARWVIIGVLVAFGALPFLAGAVAIHDGWEATGDTAVIGLRARDAWTSHAPLLGHPTTGDRSFGTPSNNPGPIEYWVLGATVRGFGGQLGLVLGAALINAAALVGILWLAMRRGGPELLALTAVALAGLVLTLGAVSLWDPFNSEVATYPMLLALLAAWSVTIGDLRVLPILIAAATVAAQVHVAGAAFVAPLVAVSLVSLIVVGRRRPKALARERVALGGSAALALVLWAPVIASELGSGPSNVAALWRTATIDRPRIGLHFVLERLVSAVAPIPAFLHRGDFLGTASALQVLLAALIIGGAGTLALHLRGVAPRGPIPWLIGLVVLAMVTSTWMGGRQPPLSAFRADGARWLWVVSLGIWVAVAWAGRALLPERVDERVARVGPVLAGAAAFLVVVGTLGSFHLGDVRDGRLMPAIDRMAATTSDALPRGTYHLQMEGEQALLTFGPALAYRLEDAGFHVQVDDNAFGRAFGDYRIRAQGDTPTIRVSSLSTATAGPDEKLLVTVPVNRGDADGATVKVFVPR